MSGSAIATVASATLFAAVGVQAVVAAVLLPAARRSGLLLAWAMLLHAVDAAAVGVSLTGAAGGLASVVTWMAASPARYFIGVPWAMLLEQLLGPGWRASIRITWVIYLVSASAATAYDILSARPEAVATLNAQVVTAGAFVGFANLFVAARHPRPIGMGQLKVLRAGMIIFLALVVHDGLVGAGVLPWRRTTSPLGVLAGLGAIGYGVVTRTVRSQRELHDLEHEMETARRIQARILPSGAPPLDGARLAFRYVPAAAVAGDLFDFLPAGPRAVGILVADVSGHGVPAALIASMVKVAAAAQRRQAHDPAAVLAGIHLALAGELPDGRFVTAVYVYIDLESGVLRHASAGHPPALVWHAGDAAFAAPPPTGPLIIPFAPPDYPVTELRLGAGDRVLLYTDGVTEATRADGELFGVERLQALVAASPDGPGRLVSDATDAAARFAGRRDARLEDDLTLVALEVSGEPTECPPRPGTQTSGRREDGQSA